MIFTVIQNILIIIGLIVVVAFFAITTMMLHDNYKEHRYDRNWMEIEFDTEDIEK